MKIDKDDIAALTGTLLIHLVALSFLFYGVMKTLVPLEDGGTPVNFGEYTAVAGIYQPSSGTTVTQPRQNQPQQQQPQPQQRQTQTRQRQTQSRQTANRPVAQSRRENVITQDREETVSVPESTNNTNTTVANENARREREENERREREENERRQAEAERQRIEAEQQKQQEEIDSRASSAFGNAGSQENSRGDATSGISNPGNPFGDPNARQTTGAGGSGTFNLSGRTTGAGGLPRPSYTEREEGRIVINITVDPNGNVISAEIGRGTNIDNMTMRNGALDAAKKAKFNKITSSNNQSGTITYNYKLN